ncbi:hypothetical protein HUJ04_011326 [Dendroctonus ponderosae]|nr:hypothetical protein HUJ04_011326 [Dendroctonus ponderosae]
MDFLDLHMIVEALDDGQFPVLLESEGYRDDTGFSVGSLGLGRLSMLLTITFKRTEEYKILLITIAENSYRNVKRFKLFISLRIPQPVQGTPVVCCSKPVQLLLRAKSPEDDLNKVETLAHEKVLFYFATIR